MNGRRRASASRATPSAAATARPSPSPVCGSVGTARREAPPWEPLESLTIVTTTANAVLKPLHDRMPVILDETNWDLWLDPAAPLPVLEGLLKPAPDALLEAYPVGPRVNNVRNDDAVCAAPFDDAPTDDSPTDDAPTLF